MPSRLVDPPRVTAKDVTRQRLIRSGLGVFAPPRGVPVLPTLLKKTSFVNQLYKTLQLGYLGCVIFGSLRRVTQLEDDLRETMTEVKALRLEWDETYEKLLKLYRKTAAERAKLEKHDSPEPDVPAADEQNGNGTSGSFLTPKQRLIQQQILRRRSAH